MSYNMALYTYLSNFKVSLWAPLKLKTKKDFKPLALMRCIIQMIEKMTFCYYQVK